VKDYISYSLFGSDMKHGIGAIRNAVFAEQYFPGWISRFYLGPDVPGAIIENLNLIPDAELVRWEDGPGHLCANLRFMNLFCNDDREARYVLYRNCDARLGGRERDAVNQWLATGKSYHAMRDHESHDAMLVPGLWGGRARIFGMEDQIRKHTRIVNSNLAGIHDTLAHFLATRIWPMVRSSCHFIDSDETRRRTFGGMDFPTARDGDRYVGQRFDENETPLTP